VLLIALMMEAAKTSETLVNFYQTTLCYNPEDSHLHIEYSLLIGGEEGYNRVTSDRTTSDPDVGCCPSAGNVFIFIPVSLLASDSRTIILPVQCLNYYKSCSRKDTSISVEYNEITLNILLSRANSISDDTQQ
jgi:hypothetical protein